MTSGMTDPALTSALEQALGIFGGSRGPGRMDVAHQAAGLKIWSGWHIVNYHTKKPVFSGSKTLEVAQNIDRIDDLDSKNSAAVSDWPVPMGQVFSFDISRECRAYRSDILSLSLSRIAAYHRFRLFKLCTA